ncbi:CDP-alcohol phosphatidyltransferase family protein [Sphingomonas sp. Leaf343]|uniref:CDP-alcohol phosphatidyltransferase family protein n=1 Tax=Sphingomonas sp. Leaf343 TaxID=1736345 RepID=UPI0006FE368B|nr:CDP-alcohol phosphatidyltransferase family protein [Sphingomonas sp. Leaf343]KQR87569.1 phosphatidylglycerophosphate synthase [Sphingomonas sp. Leaf343]
MTAVTKPRLTSVGNNPTRIWGMTNAERTRRIATAQGLTDGDAAVMLANDDYAFDPAWSRYIAARPGSVLMVDGVPVLAHVDAGQADAVAAAMRDAPSGPLTSLAVIDALDPAGIYDDVLRKREKPFTLPLTPETVPAIERASYQGAYKGVTDLLTLYLWPVWAFHITRACARIGISPNGVTAIGSVLCIVATVAFWYGWFWSGLAIGLVFMVLDTVDGKLARCTITSSKLGNAWDHGVDLVHPPFWWWAWAAGCAPYGRPLTDETFWIVIGTMLFGYVAQRLIEGAFIVRFKMHIHVWQRFDSKFRLVTARRNPNMVILFASLLVLRPDWGIIGVAAWTAISLVVHLVRLFQAMAMKARGIPIVSWLAD